MYWANGVFINSMWVMKRHLKGIGLLTFFWASIEGCIGDLGVMVPLFKDQDKDFDFLYH